MIHCGGSLPYLAFHYDAMRRHKAGERQVYCTKCRIWSWADQVAMAHKADTLTLREFDNLARAESPTPTDDKHAAD